MPKRIFIVDDSKTVRKLVRTYLENRLESIDCAEATDGLDAIHRAREVAPDLIVLDLSMPLMSGLEAGAILHDMLPKSRSFSLRCTRKSFRRSAPKPSGFARWFQKWITSMFCWMKFKSTWG